MSAFDIASAGNAAVVAVPGEIDVSNIEALRTTLREAEDRGVDRVIVDLTSTEFIDSSGISELSRLQKRLEARNCSAAIICPEANVEVFKVLSIMGLAAAIPIHATLDEAVQQ